MTLTLTLYNSNGEYAFSIEIPSQNHEDQGVLFAGEFGGVFDIEDTRWRTTDSDARTNPRITAVLVDGIVDAMHDLISENEIATSVKDFGFTYID